MPLHDCPSQFTVVRWVPLVWFPILERKVCVDISCGRVTVNGAHEGKHGGSVVGERDGVPTRMDVEW